MVPAYDWDSIPITARSLILIDFSSALLCHMISDWECGPANPVKPTETHPYDGYGHPSSCFLSSHHPANARHLEEIVGDNPNEIPFVFGCGTLDPIWKHASFEQRAIIQLDDRSHSCDTQWHAVPARPCGFSRVSGHKKSAVIVDPAAPPLQITGSFRRTR